MNSRDIVTMVIVIAVASVIVVGSVGYFNVMKTAIKAERDAEIRLIQREEEAVIQAQKTERTEERSQFWQKVVPWGDSESENNTNTIK
jgi:hypothetical protein